LKHIVICHTHWDREWFAPVSFTRSLLPNFFEKLFELLGEDPDYEFVFDGQTLMLDDLTEALGSEEETRCFMDKLSEFSARLGVGPYYGQIDWRIAEEAAFRNIELGLEKARYLVGRPMKVGWLLDNFGFSSQVPQIHNFFGIDTVFLWRGVDFPEGQIPQTEFLWKSPDGSHLLAIFALDSYRNLMRVCDFPEVAQQRLEMVKRRLESFSPSKVLPLFDGYDLDPEPENPGRLLEVETKLPEAFASLVRQFKPPRVVLEGELNSGRLVCVFPGTLSTRQHLKVMNWTCEWAITKVLEPISALAALVSNHPVEFKEEWELVLQNLIHDSMCGVSVDEVHREMERRYTWVLNSLREKLKTLSLQAGCIMSEGITAFNTNPYKSEVSFLEGDTLCTFVAPAGSIAPVKLEREEIIEKHEELDFFSWNNDYFVFKICGGILKIERNGREVELTPTIFRDNGDTYSAALKEELPLKHVRTELRWQTDKAASLYLEYESDYVDLHVDLLFTRRPIVEIKAHISGRKSGYALVFGMKTDMCDMEIVAGMPFDRVKRPEETVYSEPPEQVRPLLVAAREVGANRIFPFKDLIGLHEGREFFGFFAKGVYSYLSLPKEGIAPILLRSVEWLSKKSVEGRIGDAGPVMYVPEARMERDLTLNLALYLGPCTSLDQWAGVYLNPPILFEVDKAKRRENTEQRLCLYKGENVVFSAMIPLSDGIFCRFYNPNSESGKLEFSEDISDVWEVTPEGFEKKVGKRTVEVPAKKIKAFKLILTAVKGERPKNVKVLYPFIFWDIGKDRAVPDPNIMEEMREQMARLEREGMDLLRLGQTKNGLERYEVLFKAYKRLREALELKLSIAQNEGKSKEERMEIAKKLNEMRVKRRSIELMLSAFQQDGGDDDESSSRNGQFRA